MTKGCILKPPQSCSFRGLKSPKGNPRNLKMLSLFLSYITLTNKYIIYIKTKHTCKKGPGRRAWSARRRGSPPGRCSSWRRCPCPRGRRGPARSGTQILLFLTFHFFLICSDFLGRLRSLIKAPENPQILVILCENEAIGGIW